MSDLRNHLFETLESLKDEEKPMDIERAKAISNVAQKLIDTAKVEVAFLKVTGADGSPEFFDAPPMRPQLPANTARGAR
jgi:hypothetical protein